MMNKKMMYDVAEWSLIVGGANWALVEFLDTNLVSWLPEILGPVVYGVIGASAVYLALIKFGVVKK